jgi:cysteinyl-tRNA synthetase
MDLFFKDGTQFTNSEITQLKNKANGGKRLVISYMSIGEAENYRYYWQTSWNTNKPNWLDAENPNWAGNYKVKYWITEWQSIIYGNDNSYLKKIVDTNFDGVYLDIIDAFEYYEK